MKEDKWLYCETDDITDLDMVTEFEDVKVIVDL